MVGVMWIGLLWYFNFVQIPSMPKIRMSTNRQFLKLLLPRLCFGLDIGFTNRYHGLIVAWLNGYGHDALMLGEGYQAIGLGMWLAIIMAINVWFIIWPNQKRALAL